jgi:large subunit ribosomal protein L21
MTTQAATPSRLLSATQPPSPAQPVPIHPTAASPLAPFLKGEIYMTPYINGFPFLVTNGDIINLPFHLRDAPIGSVLRMTHVSSIGSRTHILKGEPFIDEGVYTLKMRVVEITKAPMVVTLKTKQRQRRTRHLKNKQNYTVVRYQPPSPAPSVFYFVSGADV